MTRPAWLRTRPEWPPTPMPPFWSAWDDRLGEDTSPIGRGKTEDEAIEDLMAQMEDLT